MSCCILYVCTDFPLCIFYANKILILFYINKRRFCFKLWSLLIINYRLTVIENCLIGLPISRCHKVS